jgi:hypothetical protein
VHLLIELIRSEQIARRFLQFHFKPLLLNLAYANRGLSGLEVLGQRLALLARPPILRKQLVVADLEICPRRS